MKDALIKLLKIKSIVTVILTLAFVFGALYQQIQGQEIPQPLVNIYLMIIGFYFGSQFEKQERDKELDNGEENE